MIYTYFMIALKDVCRYSFQRLLVFSTIVLILILFSGCNSANSDHKQTIDTADSKTREDTSKGGRNAGMMTIKGEPLYVYYTTATIMHNLVLKDILKKGKGKIVFQFYVDNNDVLTLAAFAGYKGQFNPNGLIVMNNSKNPVDYITKQLLLADQEMSKQNFDGNNDVQNLLDFLDTKKNSSGSYDGFVGFVPKVTALDQTGYFTIQYSVKWYPQNEEPLIPEKSFNAVPINGVTLNPCPPRNSYQ